ncbi:uncharacterized protein LOC132205304 [Neocloeon triangulifer]|uniref:uncharacterized protein LOC132205304 n=1 Tax=Neocloeon triangulifer TaxID=2078957 RepID=UPI00286EF8BE|nr:uncharacterized protein LOC132205304 [Neocloeon triangulifer]
MDKSVYTTIVATLGFICFTVAAIAVGLPLWGYFDNPDVGFGFGINKASEKGYFGPWKVCQELLYGRERCGTAISSFQPIGAVYGAGIAAAAATILLGLFCVLSVFQIAMVVSKDRVVMRYSMLVVAKLTFAILAVLLSILAAGLFAIQTDDLDHRFVITRGPSFYLEVVSIVLNFVLFLLALYDVLFSRREDGDPTRVDGRDPTGARAVTFGNPGFKENGVAVTNASGRPYSPNRPYSPPYSPGSPSTTMSTVTGSIGSVATISTNGSTRSPLRSSLKKPRPKGVDGLGIQNPGFSGGSPTLSRNGSVKKVRIQTHSTEV